MSGLRDLKLTSIHPRKSTQHFLSQVKPLFPPRSTSIPNWVSKSRQGWVGLWLLQAKFPQPHEGSWAWEGLPGFLPERGSWREAIGLAESRSPSRSLFFCFILRFWNQILTWVSFSCKELAISMRRARVKYLLKWNSFSSSVSCLVLKLVRIALEGLAAPYSASLPAT